MHEGICVGGPLDGRALTIRSDEGFLAVDKPAGKAWRYTINMDGPRFELCREPDPSLVDQDTGERRFDPDRAWDAGLQSKLDIVAVGGA